MHSAGNIIGNPAPLTRPRRRSEPIHLSIPVEPAAQATDEPQLPREFVRQVSLKLNQMLESHNLDLFKVEQEHRAQEVVLRHRQPVPHSTQMTPERVRGGGGGKGDSMFSGGVAATTL